MQMGGTDPMVDQPLDVVQHQTHGPTVAGGVEDLQVPDAPGQAIGDCPSTRAGGGAEPTQGIPFGGAESEDEAHTLRPSNGPTTRGA